MARKAFLLRIDPRLHAALAQWADDEFRSLNGHVEYLLRDALKRAGRLPRPDPDAPEAPPEEDERPESD